MLFSMQVDAGCKLKHQNGLGTGSVEWDFVMLS
jgi:hypothetical protein